MSTFFKTMPSEYCFLRKHRLSRKCVPSLAQSSSLPIAGCSFPTDFRPHELLGPVVHAKPRRHYSPARSHRAGISQP